MLAQRDWLQGPIRDRFFHWPGNTGAKGQSVLLRLCGALRGDGALMLDYPPHYVSDDMLWQAVCIALTDLADFIDRFIDSPPQTKEVRRAAGIIATMHWLHARHPLPFWLT